MNLPHQLTRELLLRRQGCIFIDPSDRAADEEMGRAVALQFSRIGYLPSTRLQDRLGQLHTDTLAPLQQWICDVLLKQLGGHRTHVPLFRNFPEDVPNKTFPLWITRVLCHFYQATGQPCLFCRRTGTTHVLSPCRHVVCDRCFDGSNYSACPVCECHVDTGSPFFKPSLKDRWSMPRESVTFKLLDLGTDLDETAHQLFLSFCARKQAMSQVDREDMQTILQDYGEAALPWLPEEIPIKETVAAVIGSLFKACHPDKMQAVARRYLKTATDVLRFLASYSGADPALQGETVLVPIDQARGRQKAEYLQRLKESGIRPWPGMRIHQRVCRFPMARLSRPMRRVILDMLNEFDRDRLIEDMLRHRSYWIWVGQFLHPYEYPKRFPKVSYAFQVIRKRTPDGTPVEQFQTFNSRLDQACRAKDGAGFATILRERPGELARRFDHALRLAAQDDHLADRIVRAFCEQTAEMSTPVLLTMHNFLPSRTRRADRRIFWPKGTLARGVSAPDTRPLLHASAVTPTVETIELELLRRFGGLEHYPDFILDESLSEVIAPFNERTASPSAVNLPRGSRIDVPEGKFARLFLHWCQPEENGYTTDLDLSIGFYDAAWKYVGVCSYYQLKFADKSGDIAVSAGDLQDAPFPDGATEFVDLDCEKARAAGIRFAVMVVNSYAGMPFSRLERSFAGLMLRQDKFGKHFDPRTVKLRFALRGESGIYLPMVFDLLDNKINWLDTHSRGQLQFNNVENSNADIMKLCPEMMRYFDSGVRMSMFELGLLHAAARAERVHIRGPQPRSFNRKSGESDVHFLARLRDGVETGDTRSGFDESPPCMAMLFHGDLDLPQGSSCYALFKARSHTTLEAADLIA